VKHFLELLDEFQHLGIEFVSMREGLDTGGIVGRALITIVSAIAELEKGLIRERVLAGMRRARIEGRHIGRRPIDLDRAAIIRDRQLGRSLGELAKIHRVSRTTIGRVLNSVPKGVSKADSQISENTRPETAA
jgi:DNA invertase Pin-like site-specific DNA recombinase